MRPVLGRLGPLGLLFAAVCLHLTAFAQKRPLDHSDYDKWLSLRSQAISADGRFVQYVLAPPEGDAKLIVRDTATGRDMAIERGTNGRFSSDSKFAVCLVVPKKADVDAATKAKKKPDEMPKNELAVLNLTTGEVVRTERVDSLAFPGKDAGWFAFRPTKDPAPAPEGQKPPPAEEPKQTPQPPKGPQKKASDPLGSKLVLQELATGRRLLLEDVLHFSWTEDGKSLVYVVSGKSGASDGVFVLDPSSGDTKTVFEGVGAVANLTVSDSGGEIAFTSNHQTYDQKEPAKAVYCWRNGQLSKVIENGMPGIPAGWEIASNPGLDFSKSGSRLYFSTAPAKPKEEPKGDEQEKPVLDVWNWRDPLLQPMQLRQASAEINRTFRAVCHLNKGTIVQLATKDMPDVTLSQEGDGRYALGSSSLPYRQLVSWDTTYRDLYLVDVATGKAKQFLTQHDGPVSFSPQGKFITWFDNDVRQWFALNVLTHDKYPITSGIPHPLFDELDDHPAPPPPYGLGGWTTDDASVVVYDRFDAWIVDPTAKDRPACLTGGYGRIRNVQLRIVRLDTERALNVEKPILLKAEDLETRDEGFFSVRWRQMPLVEKLVLEPKAFSNPVKAENADRVVYTKQSFSEFPNLWVASTSFAQQTQVSDANPQQSDYNWGTSELVFWRSADGVPLSGVLYKPENFDPGESYPLLVYIYERLSDTLHAYTPPAPGSSSINTSFYVSRGYVVFRPDIPYTVGYPGDSCMKAVLSGIQEVAGRGYIDPKRIGIQGHSWGGYQIAYMVTQTNLFACAEAGAPVSNMISAYGGIRYGTGMSRMFQYEKTQSRIGGTIWDYPLRFIENSPIFWVDKVSTPLLILHNDNDGAVPWTQGIELFTALRRLGKPSWLVNYNGEDHGIGKRVNQKDWAIRMQQFFDHYLMGAPAPAWLLEGVPATAKGKSLGLEIKGGG